MSFTLDNAHEALALAEWCFDQCDEVPDRYSFGAAVAVHRALVDLEEQLPEPCPQCGSDQCYSMLCAPWEAR